MKKRVGWLFAAALVLSVLGVSALWLHFQPRAPVGHTLKMFDRDRGLQEFLSAPLDASGQRIRALIPEGWEVYSLRPDMKQASRLPRMRHAHLVVYPKKPSNHAFGPLQQWFPPPPPPPIPSSLSGFLDAQILPTPKHKKLRLTGKERLTRTPRWQHPVSYREWSSPGGDTVYTLRYLREDDAAFKRTHDLISHGFRVK